MGKQKILIVEDNPRIRKELQVFLENNGYLCAVIENFQEFANHLNLSGIHMILLDLNLPGSDGFFLCKKIREKSNIPIIIVTSRDTQVDELMALNLGADHFVTKPYHPQILLAQIGAVLKRAFGDQTSDRLQCGAFDIILSKSVIVFKDQELELTKNELRILLALQEKSGLIVSRDELMTTLWDSNLFIDDNTLTVNVNRLRSKLATIQLEDVIETKRGQGYRLKLD